MYTEFINIGLAFFEGFALILSPCILPILPIILSASLTGSKRRPIGIIVGFVLAFTIVTVFSRELVTYFAISEETLRNVSFAILLLLGVIMLSSYLTEKFSVLTGRLTNVGQTMPSVNSPNSGFWGGILFGALIGIIWTPCAGPIFAAVIVQVIMQKTTLASLFTVMAFAMGAGIPMLLIALLGRGIMYQLKFFRAHAVLFRKLLGGIIIATVLVLLYSNIGAFWGRAPNSGATTAVTNLVNGIEHPYPAPEIKGIAAWINSPPLTLSALKGKVVLIDFWTYSCINCIRTLPYLKDWYAKYHHLGFEIIGIHSPEFEFEHNLDNVKYAVAKFGITYPVALDNQLATWQQFHNEYWPAHFLINKNGDVVYIHFGEGEYDTTENNIRFLLGLTAGAATNNEENEEQTAMQTPETYLGYARAQHYYGAALLENNTVTNYHYPDLLPTDGWALSGNWTATADKIVAASAGAAVKLHFAASRVYAVMGVTNTPVKVLTTLKTSSGVSKSTVTVKQHQLYELVHWQAAGEGELELTANSPGLEIYTFTFG